MKVRCNDEIREMRSVWMEDLTIALIDQRLLPHTFKIYEAKDYEDVVYAIKEMVVRGAPAIGATAAFALAQAFKQGEDIEHISEILESTRPTAHDLFYAIGYMQNAISLKKDAIASAGKYADDIVERCRAIGNYGEKLIKNRYKILTHCNAGALATVDIGTALAPIRFAHQNKKQIFVFVDETRPRLQGSKLTAWELLQEGIPHSIIVDNAAGYYMKEIDMVLVGADRIAANGDVANKIGTYEKAVLAKENDVPFYVAAPMSTFDFNIENGEQIEIDTSKVYNRYNNGKRDL
jgi:translation initiation factor eIF-2B subunit alpha/methylthioribose-1-phosphate isomerase